MRFYFHEHAETEFDRVVEYYEDCQRGLGIEFAQEVNAAIARIIQYPDAWSPMSKSTRRCLVNRFPFGVISRIPGQFFKNPWISRVHTVYSKYVVSE